ncbi:MAG: UDP-N-acetylmuramoyl-tripeptide--D-alanyl-D-alanine ligase [Candidatus Muirbacterium halophilum]|nr:UDP-N-acetylmuramoyl-tripeptide--D-alanyl-D-alanine ligase [Candidatus Muirbacterium halophilum]MCK9475424.1 UDP-N-acetylmuramoyl-tripeptide--D-alanyl-D-alanine ligase [Candidatus Muirbacterium halophilum]
MKILFDELMSFKTIIKIDGLILESVNGIEFDTRKSCDGKLFIAFNGANCDGNDFLGDAIKKGAKGIVSENIEKLEEYSEEVMTIHVESNMEFLKELAKYYIEKNKLKIIAVTGSSGKTTTKEILYNIFKGYFKTAKTCGNYNNMLGICYSIINSNEDNRFFITECGMNHKGELKEISETIKPEIAVIVNTGFVHGANFKDVKEIAAAKLEIVCGMKNKKFLIYNKDCRELSELAAKIKGATSFGITNADIEYNINSFDGNTSEISIKSNGENLNTKKNIYPFLVENYIAALSVVKKTGIPLDRVLDSDIGSNISMRMEKKRIADFNVYIDCYNSNPYSLEKILPQLNIIEDKWLLVLGDMKELGEDSLFWHQYIGKIFAEKVNGKLICHGEMSHNIGEGAIKAGRSLEDILFSSSFKQSAELVKKYGKDYSIFIKGSRSMNMEKIADIIGE